MNVKMEGYAREEEKYTILYMTRLEIDYAPLSIACSRLWKSG
jgi:hypothetical protein